MRTSIHDFEKKLAQVYAKIQRSPMAAENKELLRGFDRLCAAEGLSLARRWKLLEYLYVFGTRHFPKPFRGASAQAIGEAVFAIESSAYAPWTKHDYKVAIRKLFKFIEWGEGALRRRDYPDCVAGINVQIKKRDQVRIQAADILTEDEVERLLRAATDAQERAFVSMLYELGARVGEVGPMRVGSVTRDQYGFVCDLNGKTGPRSVRLVQAAGALTAWLNLHPKGDDPLAPLWGSLGRGSWGPMPYWAAQKLLKRLGRDARIPSASIPTCCGTPASRTCSPAAG